MTNDIKESLQDVGSSIRYDFCTAWKRGLQYAIQRSLGQVKGPSMWKENPDWEEWYNKRKEQERL